MKITIEIYKITLKQDKKGEQRHGDGLEKEGENFNHRNTRIKI